MIQFLLGFTYGAIFGAAVAMWCVRSSRGEWR